MATRLGWIGVRLLAAAAIVTLAMAMPASGQTQQQIDACSGKGEPTVLSMIDGCTAVIRSGQYIGRSLAVAHHNRAIGYRRTAEYDRAMLDYNEAIAIDGSYPHGFVDRGALSAFLGDYDRAIADENEAIGLAPDSGAYYVRGYAYSHKSQYKNAVQDFDEAIRLNPGDALALTARCFTRMALDQLDEALADCNRSLQLRPGYAYTLNSRGYIYLKRKDYRSAIADFDDALSRNPMLAMSLYGRGIAKLEQREETNGSGDISAAKTLQPDVADKLARYGIAQH